MRGFAVFSRNGLDLGDRLGHYDMKEPGPDESQWLEQGSCRKYQLQHMVDIITKLFVIN
jgi:hypothetical protein